MSAHRVILFAPQKKMLLPWVRYSYHLQKAAFCDRIGKGVCLMDDQDIREVIMQVYTALEEKGYRPVDQLIGYILTEDPTYITNHNGARQLICKLDRHDLLAAIVETYFPEGNERQMFSEHPTDSPTDE